MIPPPQAGAHPGEPVPGEAYWSGICVVVHVTARTVSPGRNPDKTSRLGNIELIWTVDTNRSHPVFIWLNQTGGCEGARPPGADLLRRRRRGAGPGRGSALLGGVGGKARKCPARRRRRQGRRGGRRRRHGSAAASSAE